MAGSDGPGVGQKDKPFSNNEIWAWVKFIDDELTTESSFLCFSSWKGVYVRWEDICLLE